MDAILNALKSINYSDNLYREGDWVGISGVDGFVQILDIGFRTTTLHIVK